MQNAYIGKLSINRSKALIFIVYGLVALLYVSGLYQKLYISADNRIKFHAIPVAISTLYQGHKHDYCGWRSTEIPFQNDKLLTDEFLAQQIQAPVDKAQGDYYWVADDRGYADYVIAAFALFGPHMKSLYHFWFVILLASITLFALSFGRHVVAMGFLALLVLGIHSAVSLLKLIPVPIAIYEPRYLDVLALVPVFHALFAVMFFKNEDLKKQFCPLFGQLLIFCFLYHARSSLGWQIVAMIGFSLVMLVIRKRWSKLPLLVIVLLLGGLGLLNGYKHLIYNNSYFQNMGARTFWHNALMGLKLNSIQYLIDDYIIAQMVIQYAKDSKDCPLCVRELNAQELLNTLGNWGTADWVAYESCAKKLYFSLVLQNKWEVIRMYIFEKPLQVLMEFSSPQTRLFSGMNSSTASDNAMPWNPFHLLYLIPLGGILFFSAQPLYLYQWKLVGITLAVFIAGMIPPVVFYPDILTRGGFSAAMVVLLYLGMAIFLFSVYKWIVKMIYPHRFNAYETK